MSRAEKLDSVMDELNNLWSKPCPVCGEPMKMVHYLPQTSDWYDEDELPNFWVCDKHNIKEEVTPEEKERTIREMDEVIAKHRVEGLIK